MKKDKKVYRRLGYNSANCNYKLTIDPLVIETNNWTKEMALFFRTLNGVFRYSSNEDPLARKIKLQKTNVYYVNIPQRLVEHLGYKKRQQFEVSSGSTWIKFNPFEYGTRLLGVAKKPKKVTNNLPYFKKAAEVEADENLQQMQN